MEFLQTNLIWIIVALLVVWVVFVYNGLIRTRNRVQEAWSDITVQLKRRYDLIPNLVETVKGYASHESGVFEQVTEARSAAISAEGKEQQAEAEKQLTNTLKTLFAVSENYPDLKANANFLELQRELSDTENKIQAARRFYNTTVLDLNNRVQTFPTNVLASLFSIKEEEFFDVEDEEEKDVVSVSFNKEE